MLRRSSHVKKSVSCKALQKEIVKRNVERRNSENKFVPFCNERKLGKLIVNDRRDVKKNSSDQ